MNLGKLRISRRTVTIAVAFAGVVSLAIGAHAALNKRSLDAAKAIGTEHTGSIGTTASRVALVIGNGHYPDASAPLAQPINDARASPQRCAPRVLTSTWSKTPPRTTWPAPSSA